MDAKSTIIKIRHDTGKDFTQDEESMLFNAYQEGKEAGRYKTLCDISEYINAKRINQKDLKRKAYTSENNLVRHVYCDRCDQDFPETECFPRIVGDENVDICDGCISILSNCGEIEPNPNYPNEFYLTEDGKYIKISRLSDEIEHIENQIELLKNEIEHDCRNADEYYELQREESEKHDCYHDWQNTYDD